MNAWRRFVRWLARKELAAVQRKLDNASNQLLAFGRELRTPPGSPASLHDALSEACRQTVPIAFTWSIVQRTVEDLEPGQLRITVEQPGYPRRAA